MHSFTEGMKERGVKDGSWVSSLGDEENAEYQEKGNLFIVKGTGLAENMKSLLSGMQHLLWQQDTYHEKSIKQVHKWEQSFRTGDKNVYAVRKENTITFKNILLENKNTSY